ncbi:Hypothetical predicted protein [Scomber scombrus]|uniref:Uncharacterized protein n=1 Tax=Scomber scombrus TaxID=13677 RepID=A0AAV1P0B7_SCOSC
MRSDGWLTVVNRRQKGVFASSQNKTKQNKSKTLKESKFGQAQRQEVLPTAPLIKSGYLRGVIGGFSPTFPRIVNSGVAGA